MTKRILADKNIRDGKDGERYQIVKVTKENSDLSQLNRYTVKRVRDGATIENFPGYLLKK